MNKTKEINCKQRISKEKNKQLADEASLNQVLDALRAEASTYKHAGMTHISSLLVEAV